jgi:hypothetical protein
MKKLLSFVSLASIATTVLVSPACAEFKIHGYKGTYTLSEGTYRGCLNSGGCVTLGPKYQIPCDSSREADACEVVSWKKGQYVYSVHDDNIYVTKNGKEIFKDRGKH